MQEVNPGVLLGFRQAVGTGKRQKSTRRIGYDG
jgi:hypothetical protein